MKNINEINDLLCEQIDLLRDKKTSPKEVNAVVNVTSQLLRNVKMQIEYAKLTKQEPNVQLLEVGPRQQPENITPIKDQTAAQ